MSESQIIYVHGFNSSPQSWKARQLQAHMEALGQGHRLSVPKLSHWPAQAIEQLQAEIDAAAGPVTLIGSSLGGFYSNWLVEQHPDLRAVMVNPAVYPQRLLAAWLGENTNLYTEEHYQLTPEHLAQLQALVCPAMADPSRYLLLVQTADETLDYREAVEHYAACAQFVQPGGSHGFEQFEALIPAVLAFADGRLELPEPRPLPAASL